MAMPMTPPPPPPPAEMPPPSPPAEMPPPHSASASAIATRFATYWILDALAGDESFDFSVLQALLGSWPEALEGAPEATRERLALRSLQVLSSHIPAPAGGDATATAEVLRVNGAQSCEDALSRLIREAEISGNLEKDLLPPFSQDIREIIRTKRVTLPETSFQLLKGVDPWILHQPCNPESRSYVPPQEDATDAVSLGTRSPERSPTVEGNMPVESVLASAGCNAPLQGSISEPFSQQDKHDHTAAVEPKSCRQRSPNLPHCAHGEGADDGGSSNHSSMVSSHEGLSAHATVTPGFDRISDVLPTNASEPGHLPECITVQDTTMVSQPERVEKMNQDLEDVSASIRPVEKDHTHGDLTLQSACALLSVSCNGANQGSNLESSLRPGTAAEDRMAFEEQNVEEAPLEVGGANKGNQALQDDGSMMKPSEANCFSEQENENDRTDVQKDNCHTSMRSSSEDGDRGSGKKISNEDTLEGLSQQDLCIKCGKDGELLTCCECSLAAHDSCFGPSMTFEDIDLFYCPVCYCKKAKEDCLKKKRTYLEAWKKAAAYVGTAQVSKQHDEQLNGVQQGAAKRDGHSNGSDMSKRNSIHQNEAYDLAHRDEESHQQRKKQKKNARGNGYPKEILTEKVPFQNSGPASMNNSKARVEDPEKKQQAGDEEAHKEAGNDNPSHETTASSQRACDPPLNQENEADKEDNRIASNQSSGKRSSPPWRNMRHENESFVPSKSRKVTAKQDQRRKRGSVRPQKRYSNPVGPIGRRANLGWTEEEVAMLREAMPIFTPKDGEPFPWARILEYGRHVFNKTRLPLDLRDKWRNLKKAAAAGR